MEKLLDAGDAEGRRQHLVEIHTDAFAPLMEHDPRAFRRRFRRMAADPFAFYRGSACVFYSDVARLEDPFADGRTRRVWIQGDLHAENFGTHMDGEGVLIFDVNDFDEAYVGHFTWDLQRLAASVGLLCWNKAISDDDIARLIGAYARSYLGQVRHFLDSDREREFSLRLDTTEGVVHEVLLRSRLATRVALLDQLTVVEDYERRFRRAPGIRPLDADERDKVEEAFVRYLETIPEAKRFTGVTYRVKDIVGKSGFGIGSAGLPAYSILIEGHTQALENDVVLSMKQGNVAAPSRVLHDDRIRAYFEHEGHRTVVSQRALQAKADPLLGWTSIDGVGFVVAEVSPYETDLDWSHLAEPGDIEPVLEDLGRATAKIHCVSDVDSEQTLVDFQTEEAIVEAVGDDAEELVEALVSFGLAYGDVARKDHQLFVDAFRGGLIPEVGPSERPSR